MSLFFKYTIITIFTVVSTSISAQIAQTKRVEIELKDEYTGQSTYLFGENGMVLYSKNYESETGEIVLKFEKFDKNLILVNTKEVALEYFKGYNISFVEGDNLWIFFHNTRKGNFNCLKYNVLSQKVTKQFGNTIPKFNIDRFKVLNDNLYLGGSYKKSPFLSVYD